ncbi:MAG: OmpH family outer membrane protein [Bacteroidales bacterium]|nr:OmpH family outer membrane protein [Bacteroidales bacterium]
MKHLSKFLLLLFVLAGTTSFAQTTFKFGRINSQELIDLMPERDSAFIKLDKLSKELQENMEALQNEFQTKAATYQQKQATWTAALLETKQRELEDLRNRFNQLQQSAPQDFQAEQQKLLSPVYQKANETIKALGKENGCTFVFDLSTGAIPYFDEAQSIDLLPLARKKLGIPADKVPMQINPQPAEQAAAPAK